MGARKQTPEVNGKISSNDASSSRNVSIAIQKPRSSQQQQGPRASLASARAKEEQRGVTPLRKKKLIYLYLSTLNKNKNEL